MHVATLTEPLVLACKRLNDEDAVITFKGIHVSKIIPVAFCEAIVRAVNDHDVLLQTARSYITQGKIFGFDVSAVEMVLRDKVRP